MARLKAALLLSAALAGAAQPLLACDGLLGVDFSDARPTGEGGGVADQDGGEMTDASGAPCPGRAGPPGVRVATDAGTYCIDATEVTRADYAAFLASPSIPPAPSVCTWNTDLTPAQGWADSPQDTRPVTSIDWCDAFTYCAWAGKRLCGLIGGGSGGGGQSTSQWGAACTGDGIDGGASHAYPYGDTYQAGRCNGTDSQIGLAPVGSFGGCEGAVSGAFDLSGNAAEWQDSCDHNGGPSQDDACDFQGGSFNSNANDLRCVAAYVLARQASYDSLGFRCCSE